MSTVITQAVIDAAIAIAIPMIKGYEGWHDGDTRTPHSDPILCPTGYVTVGWGRVLLDPDTGKQLKGKAGLARAQSLWPNGFSRAQCDAMLDEDVRFFADGVVAKLRAPASAQQLAALISLAYNIGLGKKRFGGSTVLRRHNAGDDVAAARAFNLWTKGTVDGKRIDLPGLVARRAQESALYLEGTEKIAPAAMAEAKPLAASRTIGGSATVIAATAGSVIVEAQDTIRPVHEGLASLGIDSAILKYVLAALIIAGAALAIYARIRDRMEGRA
ncbi:MAG: lysozyme [Niveispirillum sp.]|uniref:lysozyme n=1 Tax=Niveispirillum sp. TaxID=1917217 RepID=UPI0040373582